MTSPPHTTDRNPPETPGALPFSDIAAEQYLLAAAMWDEHAYTTVARLVNGPAFYRPAHAALWAAIAHLRTAGLPCDPVAVSDQLRVVGEHVETIRLVPRIFDLPWTKASVGYHARLVARAAVRRHAQAAAVRLAQATTLADHDAFRDELTTAIGRLTKLATAWDGTT